MIHKSVQLLLSARGMSTDALSGRYTPWGFRGIDTMLKLPRLLNLEKALT